MVLEMDEEDVMANKVTNEIALEKVEVQRQPLTAIKLKQWEIIGGNL